MTHLKFKTIENISNGKHKTNNLSGFEFNKDMGHIMLHKKLETVTSLVSSDARKQSSDMIR